jgi:hypothetical protein
MRMSFESRIFNGVAEHQAIGHALTAWARLAICPFLAVGGASCLPPLVHIEVYVGATV